MIQPIVVDSNAVMEMASADEESEPELGNRAKDFKNKLEPTTSLSPKKTGFHLFAPSKG